MAYTGKKPVDFVDVTQSQSMTVSDDLTVDTNTLYVDSTNNNVGIGTTPDTDAKLHISSNDTIIRMEDADDNGSYADIRYLNGRLVIQSDDNSASGYSPTIEFQVDGSERMRIDSSGNVGIGTTSLNSSSGYQTLSISGSTGAQLAFQTGGVGKQYIFSTSTDLDIYNSQAGNIKFSTSATERMRIDSSGNVLVGTSVAPAVGVTGMGYGSFPINSYDTSLVLSYNGTGGNYEVVFVNNNGLVGTIFTSGSATSYNTSSDYRLKEDWQPMTGATERVKALNPVNFAWKADGSRVDGFLAHEAQEVVPEAVTGEKDAMREEEYEVTPAVLDEDGNVVTEAVRGTRQVPDYQGIDQSKLVPLLTAALQEAIAKIETLEEKVAALENA